MIATNDHSANEALFATSVVGWAVPTTVLMSRQMVGMAHPTDAPNRNDVSGSRTSARCAAFLAILLAGLLTGCASVAPKADLVYFPTSAPARVVHIKSFNRLDRLVQGPRSLAVMLSGDPVSPYVLSPAGIAYDDGRLFVCDTGMGVVHEWNLATGTARRFGESGDVRLRTPVSVCLDDDRNVYVADTGRGEVVRFLATGDGTQRFRPNDRDEFRPVGVAWNNGTLYVADTSTSQIERFSVSNGSNLSPLVPVGAEEDSQALPSDVAVDAEGTLFVSDMMGGRVLAYSAEGTLIRAISQRGDRYGDMGQPRHVAIGPDGTVLVTDAEFGHVHLFDKQGNLLMLVGGPEDQTGGTPMPFGITVATNLPENIAGLVPADFAAQYFFFVGNSMGSQRVSLFAVGQAR